VRNLFILLLLTLVVGFTVIQYGGVTAREWNFTLIALCIVSLSLWLPGRAAAFAPPLSSVLSLLTAFVCGYVVFQLLPLPPEWLKVLSPSRYQILLALRPLHAERWAPLTLSARLTFAHLLRLLAYFLVFLLVRELAFRFKTRSWLAAIPVLVIGLFESSIGLAQHFGNGGNAVGTYVHHGHLAGLLEMVLPLSLVSIPIAYHSGKDRSRYSIRTTILVCGLIVCAALIMLGLLYTASRMSLAAAAISMAVLGVSELSSRRSRSGVALLIAVAGLVVLLVSAPLSLIGRYEGGLTSELRVQIWRDTLTLAAKYPVFGCGLGTFASGVQKYLSMAPDGLVDYAHNDYLQLLAELGMVGFLLVIALAAMFIRDTFGTLYREASGSTRLLATGCVASLAAIAVHSLVDFQFYIPANAMVAAWIAGIAGGIAARHRERRSTAQAGFD
jgi:O-antigen ligase